MPLIRHDSKIRLAWGVGLIPLNLTFTVLLSYRLMWDLKIPDGEPHIYDFFYNPGFCFYWIIIVSMWIDLVLDFATTVKHKLVVYDDLRSVANYYGKRWFLIDFLACIPFEYIADLTNSHHPVLWVLRTLPLIKTFKVSTVLGDLQRHLQMNPAIMRLMSFGYWFAQVVHFMSIVWVHIEGAPFEMETTPGKSQWELKDGVLVETKTEPEILKFEHGETYLRALYWVVTTVGTVGYGDYSPSKDSNKQIICTIIIEILGVSMYGYIVGNVSGLIANLDAAKAAFNKRTEEVNEFMRIKELPMPMQTRVRDYYHYLWETRHNIQDETILGELPHSLAVDVLIHLNREILEKVEFFKNANEIFIREIVKMMRTEVFLPNDFIIRQGAHGDCMYFLSNGTAEVLVNGNPVAKLGTGSPFGEMALVSGDKRTASIRAVSYCDVYTLNKDSFDQLRSRYPEFDARVIAIMEQRAQANKKA
ncbi:MAG: cyclic nucleotide-binding domain-containing protein [Verrucomicrobiota bacterium]